MRILNHFVQGSHEWLQMHSTRITMSHASDLLTGGKGVTRANYLRQVAANILAGGEVEDGYQSRDMLRGQELEPFAREAAEHWLDTSIEQVGFVLHDDARIGCSPDGLFGALGGVEIKCPTPKHHLRYLDRAQVARDHGPQMQGCMWVAMCTQWHFFSFCPQVESMPLIHHAFFYDPDTGEKIADSAKRGADEIDAIVGRCTITPPLPDISTIASAAAQHWRNLEAQLAGDVIL